MKKIAGKKWYSLKNILLLCLGFGIIVSGALIIWVSTLQLPDFKSFTDRKVQSSTKIYDRTGTVLLYDVHQNIKRTVIPYDDMGVAIKNATVAIEDAEFYQHNGIRVKSILRAVWSNISGGKVQGGSTITQQLIKNTLLTSNRTITRKIKEWILAIKLEKIMDKEDILALYLNEAPYGGNIYGIEEASKAFFGKEPRDLSLAESAYLAAIPNGPTYYSPYGKNKNKLEERKNLVLSKMKELGFITSDQYQKAHDESVIFLPASPLHIAAPHFVFFIKDYLEKRYGDNALEEGGLKVTTTLDYNLQKAAEASVLKHAKENEKLWNGNNAAAVAIDPKTGQILSMVGSRDYFDKTIDGNFNVATALRQPGSSFKPIVYADAFKKGYTDKTTLFDVKTEFNSSCDPLGKPLPGHKDAACYTPDNYDNGFRGPMTLRDALAQSINVVAVKLLYLVGIPDTLSLAHNLGISSLNDPTRYGLSLVIGGGETTLLDMTSVYSVFANEGTRNPYTGILSVEDSTGAKLEEYQNKQYQVLDPSVTHTLSSILSDNKARTPTFGAQSSLVVKDHEVAVKTGTTNNNKDAWTIGYTPSIAVGVWVGNNDNKPMKKGGAALAGPIWNDIITEGLKTLPNETFEKPDPIDPKLPPIIRGFWQGGITFKTDTQSGGLATAYTPEGTQKETSITNVHSILYWLDKNDPLNPTPTQKGTDAQYTNWEYGVQKWWSLHRNEYPLITGSAIPTTYDTLHTENSKPQFTIMGVEDRVYNKNETIAFTVAPQSQNPIRKVDIYIDNTYLISLRKAPFTTQFTPSQITTEKSATIRAIGYDTLGDKGETSQTITLE